MKSRKTIKLLTDYETAAFCSQLSLILKTGISSLEGISIMIEDSESSNDKAILQKIYDRLEETGSLHEALCVAEIFPDYMLNMINIGESTGALDDVTGFLATHYEREASIKDSLKSAITYPLIMLGMMAVIIVVLLVKVMPVFSRIFIQLGTEMTGVSKALMDVGNTISSYSTVFVILVVLILALTICTVKTNSGMRLIKNFSMKIPAIRSLVNSASACRFAGGMALALSSGLDAHQSIVLSAKLIDDTNFLNKINSCIAQVENGVDYYEALRSSDIFSGVYARMASIASRTGNMDTVMSEIASGYRNELDTKINNAIAIIEPTLVVILSLFVGIILLSVMVPLLSVVSAL